MNRDEKEALVDEIADGLGDAEAIFAIDYRGISVPQAAELREKLGEADAVFNVVKNRLAKRAAEKAGAEGLDELLVGPTALTLIKGDAVIAAKAIAGFTKEYDVLAYKGGIMDGEPLDPEGFNTIARLPGLEVLHGQLVGMTASPLTGLVAGMNNLISGLGRQLAQIAEQGLVSGEAPPAEEEAPAAEEAADAPAEDETPEEEEAPAAEEAADAPAEDETPEEEEAPAEGEAAPEQAEEPETEDDDESGEDSEEE